MLSKQQWVSTLMIMQNFHGIFIPKRLEKRCSLDSSKKGTDCSILVTNWIHCNFIVVISLHGNYILDIFIAM